jgi:diguanylate cyclase (GGDEF)-like protein/PAS domain S-box-containing protein
MARIRRSPSRRESGAEARSLREQLQDAQEALRAIRSGEVDALLVEGDGGSRVLTLGSTESAFRSLVEVMNEGAAILQAEGTLLYCNSRLAAMLKAPLETVMGSPLQSFVMPSDREAFWALMARGQVATCAGELTLRGQWGSSIFVQLSLSPMRIHGRAGICAVVTDLTDRKRAEDQVRSLSLLDELTGLFNRRGFITLAEQQLKLAHRLEGQLMLFFADLDGLKVINDTLGHVEGDRAIADAASVLRLTFREADILSRLGGDEFAVLASMTGDLDPRTISGRLQAKLDARNAQGDRPYHLSLSIGCVGYDVDEPRSIEALLALADAAMYQQKRGRRASSTSLVRAATAQQSA